MKKNKLFLSLLLFVFVNQTVTAQFGYETIDDNYSLKGSVYLYKKTILKDFTEKFGEYVADTKQLEDWYIYDEKGRKIFEYKDKSKEGNKETAYEKTIYYFNEDKLFLSANAFTIGDENDDYRFTHYKYPQNTIIEEYSTNNYDGEKIKGYTKKYNSKYLLLEESKYLGKKGGYKEVYKYDNNDEKISYIKYNGIGDLEKKIIFKRDDKGDILERIVYDAEGKVQDKAIFEHNNAGEETKSIAYNANGNEYSKTQWDYINDTLPSYFIATREGQIFFEFELEYDSENRKKKMTFIHYLGNKTNKYILYNYDNNDNLIETKTFENQKLTEKSTYSNYVGNQYLSSKYETYNEDGSIKEIKNHKNDKHGNIIAYDKYKYETKFGEKVKIPVEKYEIEILYYDGTPKLEVEMEIVKEKFINENKNKKESVIKISIKNTKVQPTIHFYDKPGVTHHGDSKPNLHKKGYSFRFQYDMNIHRFFMPYFIVEAGNQVLLVKIIDN